MSQHFPDVPNDHWAVDPVEFLATIGLIAGYAEPDGTHTFRGDAPITRYEMAALLYRLLYR